MREQSNTSSVARSRPAVSVVVPFYNSKDYLRQCLLSIINQSLGSIEIILIDDGSTDRSVDSVNDIVKRDSRVRIISQQNAGAAAARNKGIQAACGDYIAFVDSDDSIDQDFLRKLHSCAVKDRLDVVRCAIFDETVSTKQPIREVANGVTETVLTGKELLRRIITAQPYRPAIWAFLWKREFLSNNGLFIREGIVHEDQEFVPRALLLARRAGVINSAIYTYHYRASSITHSDEFDTKKVTSIQVILSEFLPLQAQASDTVEQEIWDNALWIAIKQYYVALKSHAGQTDFSLFWTVVRRLLPSRFLTLKQKVKLIVGYMRLALTSFVSRTARSGGIDV